MKTRDNADAELRKYAKPLAEITFFESEDIRTASEVEKFESEDDDFFGEDSGNTDNAHEAVPSSFKITLE